jgi:hypothetical protein
MNWLYVKWGIGFGGLCVLGASLLGASFSVEDGTSSSPAFLPPSSLFLLPFLVFDSNIDRHVVFIYWPLDIGHHYPNNWYVFFLLLD